MALARSETLNDLSGILVGPVGGGSQNIEIHPGVVQETWLLGELTLVVQPIHLSALGVGSVCLLLNFVRRLSVGLLVLSLGKGDCRTALVAKVGAVLSVGALVDETAHLVGLVAVCQVEVLHLLVSLVVLVEGVKHFLTMFLRLAICSIISTFSVHVGVVSVKGLGLFEDVLLAAHSVGDVH